MVYPSEIRAIAAHCGLAWEEIAEPYPEEVILPTGQRCTFEWALHIQKGQCIFLRGTHCQIYSCRPWICRTYPFMLIGQKILCGECTGFGLEVGDIEAYFLAHDLVIRRELEDEEEKRIKSIGKHLDSVKGRSLLLDGEGGKILEP